MNNQLYQFLIYIVSGIAISIFFDIFRVLRKSIKTSNLITYIEDAIFGIIVGLFLIWEIFTVSYGELRSYIFIGLLIGIVVYLVTVSKYFININVKILNFIKKIVKRIIVYAKAIFSTILKIINPIYKLIRKPIYFLNIKIKKLAKRGESLYNETKKKKMQRPKNHIKLFKKIRKKSTKST